MSLYLCRMPTNPSHHSSTSGNDNEHDGEADADAGADGYGSEGYAFSTTKSEHKYFYLRDPVSLSPDKGDITVTYPQAHGH